MSLKEIRQVARVIKQDLKKSEHGLVGLGMDPEAVRAFAGSKMDFLNAILKTNPPSELKN